MIDLGDTLVLTWTTAQGAPGAGPVVLTLTLPDGTTATPTVTGPVSGTWSASYLTLQAGHHRAAWSGGGQGYTDAFDVDAASSGIVSLADAKAHLNITSTTNDAEIRTMIDAATEWVEYRIGPVVRRTITATVTPASDGRIYLEPPVISLTSLTSAYGYTETFNLSLVYTDLDTGVLHHGSAGGTFAYPVTVTYVAGRAIVPSAVRLATMMMLKAFWETQRGPGPEPAFQGQVDDVAEIPGMGLAIWKAEKLLEPYMLARSAA